MALHEFLEANREEILKRCRARAAKRSSPLTTDLELETGLPLLLGQLGESLRRVSASAAVDHVTLRATASDYGGFLFHQGLTVGQVVHDYGDLCQVITSLATELNLSIDAAEFKSLNFGLDDAIAGAVTEFERQRERATALEGSEKLGLLAHEMRNLLNVAMLSFGSIKRGIVGPGGSTGAVLERSLVQLNTLIHRSLAEVRLDRTAPYLEVVPLWTVIEAVEIGAALLAQTHGLAFKVHPVDPNLIVEVDKQILAAALTNLLQNAFKFTRPLTTVSLLVVPGSGRVSIEVEDECGGLPSGATELLLQPFVQKNNDRSGLGLGLSICVKAMKTLGGELRIRDLPGKGCVFALDLPLHTPPASA
jgi:signal transduction histidine kinase